MDYTAISIEEIKDSLKQCLTEERYLHSIGAMDSAIELAQRFNLDTQKAAIAGLLHDCAKCIPADDLLYILKNKCESYEECELINLKTWHAPVSAYIAKTDYGVTDSEILSSIRWHTLGKTDMSPFEMVIFLADKIEKNTREEECRQKILKALNLNNSLEEAVLKCFKMTIKSLLKRKLTICWQTVNVYNKLVEKIYSSDSSAVSEPLSDSPKSSL